MSLINDALRRANQSKKQQPAPHSSGAPMRPVEPAQKTNNTLLPVSLLVLLVIALGFAGWFFWLSSREESKSIAATKKEINLPKTIPPVAEKKISVIEKSTPVAPVLETKTVPITEPPPNIVVAPTPTPAPAPAPEATPVVAAKPEPPIATPPPPSPPALKLQGIFYRTTNPTALISGNTVGVGETVSGARVLSITSQQVTLEWNGQKIVLNFGSP
jgi:hypothetical protein